MREKFREITGIPRFIVVVFIVQFVLFLTYWFNNREDTSLIYISGGILLLGIFLAFTRLKIEINRNAIEYKFLPFSKNKILWKDVSKVEIVNISAVTDFLGWGIRWSPKFGWGYITNSDHGIFITKNNGKKVTISIKDNTALAHFLEENNLSKVT